MRHALYEAANSHLRICKKRSVLKAWGVKLAKRVGNKKALRGGGAQARDHHAPDVGQRFGLPARQARRSQAAA